MVIVLFFSTPYFNCKQIILKEESIFIKINSEFNSKQTVTEELHIKHFYTDENAPPVMMIHGAIENGKIFYSSSGKGLAPYLAQNGYDVFVVDLRGRGLSKPSINKNSKHGLTEILRDDFPAYIKKIKEIKGDVPQHWIAHSWGGVMMLAYLAKNFESVKIASMVFFGTKRRITIMSFKKIWRINIMWNIFGRLLIASRGYLPAKEAKIGSDNETKKSNRETNVWAKSRKWLDWNDKFDYAAALKKIKLPPTLYLCGENDDILGHPKDVKLLMTETGEQDNYFQILGKSTGNKNDYGHNDILTHQDAAIDVYPIALNFMKNHHEILV